MGKKIICLKKNIGLENKPRIRKDTSYSENLVRRFSPFSSIRLDDSRQRAEANVTTT